MKQKVKNYDYLIGTKNGMLTCKSYHRNNKNMPRVVCDCDCGNEKELDVFNFVGRKNKLSCGCNKGKKNINHDWRHPLYKIWMGMKMRCYNKNDNAYGNYGAKGYKVCDEWLNNVQLFIDWALENGWRKGKFIDKDIKNPHAREYSPDNCSIVTRAENNRARRCVKIKEEYVSFIKESSLTVKELAKKYEVSISTIYSIKHNSTWKNLKTS